MSKRPDKPQRYGKGGRFGGRQISRAGISAIQEQGRITTEALKEQARQQREIDSMQIKGFERKNKLEQDNAKELYSLEVDAPYKARMNAFKTNIDTEIQNLKREEQEYRRLANVWGKLSPTLATTFQDLTGNTIDLIQTKRGRAYFNQILGDGTLDKILYTYNRVEQKSNALDDAANEQSKKVDGILEGDVEQEQEFDYLNEAIKTNNPVVRKLVAKYIDDNFDSIMEDRLANYENNIDKYSATEFYQLQAQDLLKRTGISPNSKQGLEIMQKFTNKGLSKESQLSLEQKWMNGTDIINNGLDQIEGYMKDGDYKNANAQWKIIQNNVNALPVKNADGVYSRKLSVNRAEEFILWAEDQVGDARFLNRGEAGFLHAQKVLLGIDENNPYGYEIVGAKGKKDAKHNRISGKNPNHLIRLRDAWERADSANTTNIEHVNDRRLQAEAIIYKDRINSKNEDGSSYYVDANGQIKDAFWSDWKGVNGNKYARQYMAGMIGFAAGDVDTNTLNSNLVQALRQGRDLEAYMIWASSYSDEKQNIGIITEGLRELSSSMGVEPNKLDNVIADQMKSTVNKVMEADSLDSVLDPSGQHKARQMAGAFIYAYNSPENTGTTVAEKRSYARAALNEMLGISNKTGEAVKFDSDGYRGSGEFRQKRTKSGKVIFVRDAGVTYNGTTSIEINDALTNQFGANLKGDAKNQALKTLISNQIEDEKISGIDLYNFLNNKPHNDSFLNHLEKDLLGNIPPNKFKNEIKDSYSELASNILGKASSPDNKKSQDKALQWGAAEWCESALGPNASEVYGKNLDRQAFAVCMQNLKTQAVSQGVPLYQLVINPNLFNRLVRP